MDIKVLKESLSLSSQGKPNLLENWDSQQRDNNKSENYFVYAI